MKERQLKELMDLIRRAMDRSMLAGERIMETDGSFDEAFNEGCELLREIEFKLREVVE